MAVSKVLVFSVWYHGERLEDYRIETRVQGFRVGDDMDTRVTDDIETQALALAEARKLAVAGCLIGVDPDNALAVTVRHINTVFEV